MPIGWWKCGAVVTIVVAVDRMDLEKDLAGFPARDFFNKTAIRMVRKENAAINLPRFSHRLP